MLDRIPPALSRLYGLAMMRIRLLDRSPAALPQLLPFPLVVGNQRRVVLRVVKDAAVDELPDLGCERGVCVIEGSEHLADRRLATVIAAPPRLGQTRPGQPGGPAGVALVGECSSEPRDRTREALNALLGVKAAVRMDQWQQARQQFPGKLRIVAVIDHNHRARASGEVAGQAQRSIDHLCRHQKASASSSNSLSASRSAAACSPPRPSSRLDCS